MNNVPYNKVQFLDSDLQWKCNFAALLAGLLMIERFSPVYDTYRLVLIDSQISSQKYLWANCQERTTMLWRAEQKRIVPRGTRVPSYPFYYKINRLLCMNSWGEAVWW